MARLIANRAVSLSPLVVVPAAILPANGAVDVRVLISSYALRPRGADGRAVDHHVRFQTVVP